MISFISSWAEQIVLAVIVATIIELILPKNKNKKYIQMVIGVYVLFNIISPIIKNKDEKLMKRLIVLLKEKKTKILLMKIMNNNLYTIVYTRLNRNQKMKLVER